MLTPNPPGPELHRPIDLVAITQGFCGPDDNYTSPITPERFVFQIIQRAFQVVCLMICQSKLVSRLNCLVHAVNVGFILSRRAHPRLPIAFMLYVVSFTLIPFVCQGLLLTPYACILNTLNIRHSALVLR